VQAAFVIYYAFPKAILGLLHRGAKGVAVVTCPYSPGLEPGWSLPLRWWPRGFFVAYVPPIFASFMAGRSLKRIEAVVFW